MFLNLAILLILVAINWENPDSCCCMYSKKAFDDSNHPPIFLILSSSNPSSFIEHAPPARFEWVPILSIRIFLLEEHNFSAVDFIWKIISLSVISPLTTLSQYAHTNVSPSDLCTQICATRLASAIFGHANICPSNAPWCTHALLNNFFCSVIFNVSATAANSYCLLVLRGRGERRPQVLLSLKNMTSFTKNCWVIRCRPCHFGAVYSPTRKI